jgi:hypothetical protein
VQLLAVLPTAPTDWKVTRSEADNSLGEWLETRATRTFQPPPTPSAGSDAAPATPLDGVEVSVVDTAGFAPSLGAFAGFTPGKSSIIEKKLLGSLPTIIISGEGGRQLVQVLVSARFIVEITLPNLPKQHVEDWLRAFHFDISPQRAPTTRPSEFRLTHVDELHPENNRSYIVSATNSKRVDEFLKALPSP